MSTSKTVTFYGWYDRIHRKFRTPEPVNIVDLIPDDARDEGEGEFEITITYKKKS